MVDKISRVMFKLGELNYKVSKLCEIMQEISHSNSEKDDGIFLSISKELQDMSKCLKDEIPAMILHKEEDVK